MRHVLCLAVALLAAARSPAAPSLPATGGATLLAELHRDGPAAVMHAHFDDSRPGGDDGYAVVNAGSADGIAVAVALLRTVADGGVAESLHSALGTALQRRPEHVLPYIDADDHLRADMTCLPFLPADDLTARQVLAQALRSRAALDRPASRRFPRQRAACLRQVDHLVAVERRRL